MTILTLIFSERFWGDVSKFNVSIGLCALAFACEMTLFLTSAYLTIRARANSLVRLENEEIDALLQGKGFLYPGPQGCLRPSVD